MQSGGSVCMRQVRREKRERDLKGNGKEKEGWAMQSGSVCMRQAAGAGRVGGSARCVGHSRCIPQLLARASDMGSFGSPHGR